MKIPKSKAGLKRPVDKHHVLVLIEKENVWVRSLNRKLAETVCSLVTQGEFVTAERTAGVVVWGTYAGEPEKSGSMILDHKPDSRFKLIPVNGTPDSLLTQVAHLVGRHGSITSVEGKHGLIFRGELRNPGESIQTEPTAQESKPEVASAREETLEETVKIPESKAELKRPVDKHHALLLIEKENVWVRSLNHKLAETVCSLVTQGDPITVKRSAGVVAWGTYAGEPEKSGSIILDHKPDGRFKLIPVNSTPDSLMTQVAHFAGRHGSVTSVEGKHGLIFRGELRNPDEPIETEATAQESKPEVAQAAEAPAGGFEKITGADAIAAIKQKVSMEFIDHGIKVRIRGRKADCEKTAKRIIKGRPTLASEQGAKYMIEGNLNKSFLMKGSNQQGPDANGVLTRTNVSEHTFTAIGENLPAVRAACLTFCKESAMFTIVINDRSVGHLVISSGKKSLL